MKKFLKSTGSWLAGVVAAIFGTEALKNAAGEVAGQVIKDFTGKRKDDEVISEAIITELAVDERFKVLLTKVRSEIEKDYRKYVIRREGSERDLWEARESKYKKDDALLAIGQSEKEESGPNKGQYLYGRQAAYAIFRGVDSSKTDYKNKKMIRANLLTIGTDRRVRDWKHRGADVAGDAWRKKIKPVAVTTGKTAVSAGGVVAKEAANVGRRGFKIFVIASIVVLATVLFILGIPTIGLIISMLVGG